MKTATESTSCLGCNGTQLDAADHADGLCCFAAAECPCGNLVDGDGTPRCAYCAQPLCDDCRRINRTGDRVHRNSELCQ